MEITGSGAVNKYSIFPTMLYFSSPNMKMLFSPHNRKARGTVLPIEWKGKRNPLDRIAGLSV